MSAIFPLYLILFAALSACASAPATTPVAAQGVPAQSAELPAAPRPAIAARAEAARDEEWNPALLRAWRAPVSLDFRDAPLQTVLQALSKASGLQFVYDPQVSAELRPTLFVKQASAGEALQFLLHSNQLSYKSLGGTRLLVYPDTQQKRDEHQVLMVRSFYLANADVKAVANTLKSLLNLRNVSIDERLGMLSVRDTPQALRLAEQLITVQDLADPELVLEVEILEVKRQRLQELGLHWPEQLTLSPLAPESGGLSLAYLRQLRSAQVQLGALRGDLRARAENQDVQILAQPRIRVRSKERAKLQIGDRVPIVTTTSTATGFVADAVNYIDVGIKLEAEPVLDHQRQVALKLSLEVSSLVREIISKSGSRAYQIGTRSLNTALQLQDGETAILAGLISDEERQNASHLPVLGELPLASRLFGSATGSTQRSEILLAITPRVVRALPLPIETELYTGTHSKPGVRE